MKKIGVLSICLLVASCLWAQKDPAALKKVTKAAQVARTGETAAKIPQIEHAVKAAVNNAVRTAEPFANIIRQKVAARCEFTTDDPDDERKLENWARTQPDYFPGNYLKDYLSSGELYKEPWHPAVKFLHILVVDDNPWYVDPLYQAAQENPLVTIEWASTVKRALMRLKENPHAYDVILLDWMMEDGDKPVTDLSMYVYNEKLGIPIIQHAAIDMSPAFLLKYNMIGRKIKTSPGFRDEEELFNYLSNIVATGKAYPNGKKEIEED